MVHGVKIQTPTGESTTFSRRLSPAFRALLACGPQDHLPRLGVDEMSGGVIERPVINSPFDEPKRRLPNSR